jgi:hypothetical protein
MATVTPNFNWPVPTSTDLVKDGATAIEALGDSIDASLVDLKGGTTGQVLSKTTGTDMDFTWVTTDDANAIQNSIVDAKGDLIAASANDTPARLAVGNNGETLVADSSTSTGLRWQGSAIGKNAVFNSGYDIFQRSSTPTTGITTTGAIAYTLDRWQSWTFAAGGSVVTSQQVTGDTTNLPFIRYCARFRRATGNTDTNTLVFGQALENTDSARFIGQTVTMSFYARRGANYSQTANQMSAQLWSNTTTDGGLNTVQPSSAVPVNNTVTLTTTWQRFQATGTVSSTATQIALAFVMTPSGTAGANDYFEVTGVQLELGSIATPFAKMGGGTIQGELAACQRYYWRQNATSAYTNFGTGFARSTTIAMITIATPVQMRSTPGAIEFSTLGVYDGSVTGVSTAVASTNIFSSQNTLCIDATATGLTNNRPYSLVSNASSSAYIAITAEL